MMNRGVRLIEFQVLEIGEYFSHRGSGFQKLNPYQAELLKFNSTDPTGSIYTFNDREMVGDD